MPDKDHRRERMVTRQIEARGIDDERILAAFRAVPRERFVPDDMAEFVYDDSPLPIGEGQTISQPFIVASMIEAARIDEGDRVLEVGAGSGYAAAVLSRIAAEVFAIERHEKLARQARERVEALGYDNCRIIAGDGMKGLAGEAPFEAILVAARGLEVPDALKDQLAIGGRLIIPVGDESVQQLTCITRTAEHDWDAQEITAVRFVPLLPGAVPEDGSRSASNHVASREKSTPELIAHAAIALPDLDDPAFAETFDRFADRRVVMLGEASHGTHEFYAARAAITKRLVERHGFTILAVEGDWPDAAAYDRLIRGKGSRADRPGPFQRFPTWMWRNTVMPGLLRDLRSINQGREEAEQAGFHGLDIYNMNASIAAVLDYLDEHDPEAAAAARERYGCLTPWQADPATYGRAALKSGYARCEEPVVEQCREMLGRALEEDGESFGAAMNARLVASAERYYRAMYYGGAESWNLRDAHMAETLEHLLEHRGPNAKAVVWAHNSHIGDARATEMGRVRGEHNIGQLAREKWGEDVALVGFGTHGGTVTAASNWDGDHETKRVNPSRRDSYERLFHESGASPLLADFGTAPELAGRLGQPRLERFIGVIYRPDTERWSHYSDACLPEQFDAYCWFDETRALEPLADREPHGGGGEDLYPFGL
ncbi:protein-L-isoaspartate(D-aspartate) O-methyltransferase [Erythrobacter sp. HL-111]|uniref:protein-L-isoaspartate(D-aspartate) O-methyltransferase n=1 Tax=Erythrobacter sp. HL-111 TaxID=1798193 RepID=UPI000B7D0C3B|nr:protein-L-isoaspartate(D-aspartate) O-methyltransferase [Erythrobacter sp. HL-111]